MKPKKLADLIVASAESGDIDSPQDIVEIANALVDASYAVLRRNTSTARALRAYPGDSIVGLLRLADYMRGAPLP